MPTLTRPSENYICCSDEQEECAPKVHGVCQVPWLASGREETRRMDGARVNQRQDPADTRRWSVYMFHLPSFDSRFAVLSLDSGETSRALVSLSNKCFVVHSGPVLRSRVMFTIGNTNQWVICNPSLENTAFI